MNEVIEFLVRHGVAVLFVAVFIEQLGAPIPSVPWLLAAGAMSVDGRIQWLPALITAAVGSLMADLIWFHLGRYRGHQALKLLCRLSLEPDSCVRRTQDLFTRYGMRGVVMAKFLPGFNTLGPAMAGMTGIALVQFLCFDALAAVLYVGSFIVVGAVFSRQLEEVITALSNLGNGALALVAGLFAAFIGYKLLRRHRLLRELRMARISVDELYQKLESGERLLILDLRSRAEVERTRAMIHGALHMTLDEVQSRQSEIPRDRDIILYCSCPNEVTSARVALLLQRKGIVRVRPLLGGFDAWQERNYPTELKN